MAEDGTKFKGMFYLTKSASDSDGLGLSSSATDTEISTVLLTKIQNSMNYDYLYVIHDNAQNIQSFEKFEYSEYMVSETETHRSWLSTDTVVNFWTSSTKIILIRPYNNENYEFGSTYDIYIYDTIWVYSETVNDDWVNLGSTISLTRADSGIEQKIHFTAFKFSKINSEVSTNREYYTMTENVEDNISASISVTPIVTYDSENAFAYDIQANEQITFNFIRKNPYGKIHIFNKDTGKFEEHSLPYDSAADDRLWCNRKWIAHLTEFINRWQVRSDGCVMTYTPLDSTLQYPFSRNVYIKSFSHKESIDSPEITAGSLDLQVGSMTGDAVRSDEMGMYASGFNNPVDFKDMYIKMTSSDKNAEYILYSEAFKTSDGKYHNINCVSSYSLKGGPEQPFEYLIMYISKKRLSVVAPDLANDIVAGKNLITLNAMGKGTYMVTKCSTSNNDYKITAYSLYEIYQSSKLNNPIPFGQNTDATPLSVILAILKASDLKYGADDVPTVFTDENIYFAYRNSNNKWDKTYSCSFGNDASVWYILSVCALRLNCKIWFSNFKAYIIDTTLSKEMIDNTATYGVSKSGNINEKNIKLIQTLYLNSTETYPLSPTYTELQFQKSVCGKVSLGDEGAETIHNSVFVQFNSNKDPRIRSESTREVDTNLLMTNGYSPGETRTCLTPLTYNANGYKIDVTKDDMIAKSQSKYGVKEVTYNIPEISIYDADAIATNVAETNCDSEQSIGFTLKESHREMSSSGTDYNMYWQKFFPSIIYVRTIVDHSHDLMDSNLSNFPYSVTSNQISITESNFNTNMEFKVGYEGKFTIKATIASSSVKVPYTYRLYKFASTEYTEQTLYADVPVTVVTGISMTYSANNSHVFNQNGRRATEVVVSESAAYMGENNKIIYEASLSEIRESVYVMLAKYVSSGQLQVVTVARKGMFGGVTPMSYSTLTTQPSYTEGTRMNLFISDQRQEMPNKLTLSTYEHNFPDGTTEYWFGIIKPTDVSQNSSEIANAINNH